MYNSKKIRTLSLDIKVPKGIKTFADGIVQEDEPSVDEEMYGKLQDPCTKAKMSKDPNYESYKICKAEMDLHSALQRVRFLWVNTATSIIKVIN